MEDYKLRHLRASHTLGWSSETQVARLGKKKLTRGNLLQISRMAEGVVNVHGVEFTRRDGVGERCELVRREHSV